MKNQLFWHTIKNVKGDFIADDVEGSPRVLIIEDESRMEIPTTNTLFKFSKERFQSIKENIENQTGEKIETR